MIRAAIATVLAAMVLLTMRCPVPPRAVWPQLALAATCVVFGFPILTSMAMAGTTASVGAVVIALLPLATVIATTVLGQQRPSAPFWVCAVLGAAVVVVFSVLRHKGSAPGLDDALLALAVISGGFGYAWGGMAAARIGGWQTICWTLIIAAPVSMPLAIGWAVLAPQPPAPLTAWLAVVYLAAGSQLIGFFFFYGGMAIGGVARVSQVQLLQLFITLAFSAAFLGEEVESGFWFTAVFVVLIVAAARLAPVRAAPVSATGIGD